LLATAREQFLREGYLATSLDKVADAAGFSKGAVYSNFRNKDQLCLAVLDEIRAERAAEVTELVSVATTEERLRRFESWAERVIGDPQWTTLELEFAVAARRNPELRAQLAERLAAVTHVVESAVAGLADNGNRHTCSANDANGNSDGDGDNSSGNSGDDDGESGSDDRGGSGRNGCGSRGGSGRGAAPSVTQAPMAVDQAAVSLLCLGVGLGFFRAIDPSMPVSALVGAVRVLAGLPAAD
jgi:hypothetical protein